jgi:hypothetical protein
MRTRLGALGCHPEPKGSLEGQDWVLCNQFWLVDTVKAESLASGEVVVAANCIRDSQQGQKWSGPPNQMTGGAKELGWLQAISGLGRQLRSAADVV